MSAASSWLQRCAALPVLLMLASAGQAAAGSSSVDCEPLTGLDEEALATYRFESGREPWQPLPPDADYQLGEITVVRQDVFERADNWLQRQANRYHVRTRERVVLSVLPMRSGERVDARLLAEAERLLRAKNYLYDARVIPRRRCGDVLDIYVVTRDVWTLMPRVSVTRAGGETDLGLGVGDTNVAGLGKTLALGFDRDEDRRGWSLSASDPNIRDSRWAADLFVVDNDDGELLAASLRRPFFALDTRRYFRLDGSRFDREEGLYYLGDEIWEYRAETESARVAAGWSPGLRGRFVNRFLLGVAVEDHRFELPPTLLAAFPDITDPERRFVYPFIGYQNLEDDYDKRVNVDRVRRTEDLALGRSVYVELGYSSDATGGDGEYLVGRVNVGDAAWLTPRQLLTGRAWANGYFDLDADRSENLFLGVLAEYRYRHATKWSLAVRASAAALKNPTLDRQLLLGGSDGLRGYPNRYQIGDRRFLVTVEERYYSNIYPLRMFRLGAAAFVDAGRAWYEDEAPPWLPADDGSHRDELVNVGLGLRLESTRTRGDAIIHLDVAMPLRDGPGVRDVEVTLTAKQTL
tara:strand:+ start:7106 stop:8839 length:1734 start_codon:yes stop_codon:yes gene_type:complete